MGSHDDATTPGSPAATTARSVAVPLPARYRVIEVIGEGGMGRVYRAHDLTLGRDVAIKVIETDLLPGPDKTMQRERFAREARAAARLVHPNIVAVHDVDPDAGWLVMDLVEGASLRELLARGKTDPSLVRHLAEQVLSALDCAHAAGVIHRDIKPSNIILDASRHATLIDFGVARLVDAEMTRTGESLGTPAYMAPEQIRGATVDARTDLYGLAATLYELVTGQRMVAFESPSAIAIARVEDACPDQPGLARVISRCLQADPDARFQSARDASRALAEGRARAGWSRRRKLIAGGAAAVVAVGAVAALGAGLLARRSHTRDPHFAQAFTLAQRGENEKASGLLEDYLGDHPDDGDALTLKFLVDWWASGVVNPRVDAIVAGPLRPDQRALVHGITLITERRENEAIAYLQNADAEHPNSVEILYALGEARWHGQLLEDGAATLERAFRIDPHWEMALHHLVELRLSRGEGALLRPIVELLRPADAASAATLDCEIAISDRHYADAAAGVDAALARLEKTPELYICKAKAQTLAGDLDGARTTAKTAFELWPIDDREWGGFSLYAETFLYRGELADYLKLVASKPSAQRTLTLSLWQPRTELSLTPPVGPGMRMPPFGFAEWILGEQTHGHDEAATYSTFPEPEVRAYGQGLSAEQHGDTAAAIASYRYGLDAVAKGDIRMLLAHHLARVLHATGDVNGAARACDEVIAPRVYQDYRAVLLPDCLLWTEDPTAWRRLVASWTGTFDHPAVVEARRRLAAVGGVGAAGPTSTAHDPPRPRRR